MTTEKPPRHYEMEELENARGHWKQRHDKYDAEHIIAKSDESRLRALRMMLIAKTCELEPRIAMLEIGKENRQ